MILIMMKTLMKRIISENKSSITHNILMDIMRV